MDIIPTKREEEMFWLRTVEGLTLREIGERYGVTDERVRQLLRGCYHLRGVPPAAQARRRAVSAAPERA